MTPPSPMNAQESPAPVASLEEGQNGSPRMAQPIDPTNVQQEIEVEACIPMSTPLLLGRPPLRRSRTPRSTQSLRRSVRQALRPRAANATRQAQNVLLKKLGIHVHEDALDADVKNKFKAAFHGDLSDKKKQAMQMLLNDGIDFAAMDLDMGGLDQEVVL